MDAVNSEEITEFLNIIFKLYPTVSEKELTYYISTPDLQPIGKEYVFAELLTPVYTKSDNEYSCQCIGEILRAADKSCPDFQFDMT